jgi:hypothetical protein
VHANGVTAAGHESLSELPSMGEHTSVTSATTDDTKRSPVSSAGRLTRGAVGLAVVAAGFAIVAGAAFVAMTMILRYIGPGSPASDRVTDCAVGACQAPRAAGHRLPPPLAGALVPAKAGPTTGTPRLATPAPSGRNHGTPSPVAPPPTPARTPPGADVVLSFSSHRDSAGFDAWLTLVNQGGSALSGWQIYLRLPGDQLRFVRHADGQMTGDTLALQPSGQGQPLPPGGSLTIFIAGQGPTLDPASCTYNGSACAWAPGQPA